MDVWKNACNKSEIECWVELFWWWPFWAAFCCSFRRPIIAIDLAHMSGSYGGALFLAIAYDANDSMFPLTFGVMSSENYEDWLWFLEKLKIVVGNMEVIIISDRHPALLRSVPKVFGIENHTYCYHHLKENFSSFLSKHNIRGNKGKKMHCNS